MKIYIRAAAAISPQKTFEQDPFLEEPLSYTSNRLQTFEPDYTKFIDVKALRRMSRVIKMGVTAALGCLQEAGEKNPGAIITGTAYGCLEDTETFLTQTIERNEEMPPPTPFIQSTHNTVGAQIALILKCHQYNNTFAQGGASFENALLDAILLLREEEAKTVLAGSVDELTATSFTLLKRFGLYKANEISNLLLYGDQSKGTIAGEGAAFFLLSSEHSHDDYGLLEAMHNFYKPVNTEAIEKEIAAFLEAQSVTIADIDLIIMGKNGDSREDSIYTHLERSLFANRQTIPYKHLCGEYPTAVSFALWMAANILKKQTVPVVTGYIDASKKDLNRILIYNHYQNKYHSLLLLSRTTSL
ncbi:MAG: beta-ketoacyl synthase chain length factor [Bacteroidota bacterium]